MEGLWAQARYNESTVSLINSIQRLGLSIGASGPRFLMDVSRLGDLKFLIVVRGCFECPLSITIIVIVGGYEV